MQRLKRFLGLSKSQKLKSHDDPSSKDVQETEKSRQDCSIPTCNVPAKGFRVCHIKQRSVKIGIAASSLDELKRKAMDKLQIDGSLVEILVYLTDGTEIDSEEFFKSLQNQTSLIISRSSDSPHFREPSLSPIDAFLETIRWTEDVKTTIESIQEMFSRNNVEIWTKILNILEECDRKVHLSHIKDDPDWFQDLSTNAQTKEDYMVKNCQARIRSYLTKTEVQLKHVNISMDSDKKTLAREVVAWLRSNLKENRFHGDYFNRKSVKESRICDESGFFICEGRFDQEVCSYSNAKKSRRLLHPLHKINPYESRESRIVFSTWNLDHVIERSRSIVPSLITAIKSLNNEEFVVNVSYFYELLFTRANLKLVHVVCHDKQEHKGKKCDKERFYLKRKD